MTVDYATADGTAAALTDYTPANGSLRFDAGVLALTVTVPLLDDSLDEDEEDFTLTVRNPRQRGVCWRRRIGDRYRDDRGQRSA